jgi:hypothetical protein
MINGTFATGAIGIFAVVLCCLLAIALWRLSAGGSVARKLSILLLIEGVTLVTSGYIDLLIGFPEQFYTEHPLWLQVCFIIHTLGDCVMLALYPPFLASALQTKFTQPFSKRPVRFALWVIAAVFFVAIQLSPLKFGALLLYLMLSMTFAFAFVASIHAWRSSSAGIARDRARIFVIAFGVRDLCWGFVYVDGIRAILAGTYLVEPEPEYFYLIYAFGTLFAIPLIAYGILRTQLFDIDLRIRWTIKQSTMAAIFVAFVYLISEGADRFLSSELGNWAGLLASALVVFFLAPLQRFAERVANAAMPNTTDTPEYAAFRKLQVYEAAIAEAQQEGAGISDRERALLNRLRESLGITESDAARIESELRKQLPSYG